MQEKIWIPEMNRTLVCVDSYCKGVPSGRFYSSYAEAQTFDSMSQFLLKMEDTLDERQAPQSYTAVRTFSELLDSIGGNDSSVGLRKGLQATFEIMVLFRQHTSWQGVIRWKEGKVEQSFRSVLELIRLMDSAMRSMEGSGLAV